MASAYQGRGTASMDQGHLESAIVDFTRAIQLDPNLAHAHINRGLALLLKGRGNEANYDFQSFLALRPDLRADLERRTKLAREFRAPKH
jgi:tetratricopeptide (TPR) repeat protein